MTDFRSIATDGELLRRAAEIFSARFGASFPEEAPDVAQWLAAYDNRTASEKERKTASEQLFAGGHSIGVFKDGNLIAADEQVCASPTPRTDAAEVHDAVDWVPVEFARLLELEAAKAKRMTDRFSREELADLDSALLALSMALGNPAMIAAPPQSVESELIRYAAQRLSAPSAAPVKAEPGERWWYDAANGCFFSDDFTHDAALKLTGDFADEHDKTQYAAGILMALSARSSAALTGSDGEPSAPLIEVWAVYRQDTLHAVDLTEKKARARRDLMPNADTVKVVRAALSTGRFAAPAAPVAQGKPPGAPAHRSSKFKGEPRNDNHGDLWTAELVEVCKRSGWYLPVRSNGLPGFVPSEAMRAFKDGYAEGKSAQSANALMGASAQTLADDIEREGIVSTFNGMSMSDRKFYEDKIVYALRGRK